ncbi:Protein of unknown function DUF429 [Sulfolobus islandicus Y.G.57.14]|jgi:Uncharacterized conserved protein|uniref:DUF429 domain-containing protein n=3 Tax=Saccharolobus islandicus TaxID=43080 RepID=C3MN76_SACI2|nr:DUF429 domain-containing protein [Sulfolobus islandicus]ACP36819.1 Protein of unknown function DUF429 [Sulfolobus islandicus L.S.2.15]ACP47119.1 Protein of unknown function DUF429 [Sulfolobus islandicus Y.G.57.14]ACP49971.1 Protein of unknown function DUF429 [Sulfolobus islandicus Y.N.15.51]
MYCGIDLAVRRKTAVGILINNEIKIIELTINEEIIESCNRAKVTAIDSPLSHHNGFRNVDKELIKRKLKVLPPSFMKKLVERAIQLKDRLNNVIETHPTSSMKLIGLNWRELHEIKDYVDAALCAMTAMAYDSGYAEEIKADDGTIYLLSTKFPYEIKRKNYFEFYLKGPK